MFPGSGIRVAPGARLPDCCVVGPGSVLIGSVNEGHCLVAGVPAKRRRALRTEDYDLILGKTRPDLPDEVYPAMPVGLASPAQETG